MSGLVMAMAKKILSVAANPAIRASREQLLTQAGFDVVSASNIKELIRACEESPKFHLFILGEAISEPEKYRAVVTIKTYCPKAPILDLLRPGTRQTPEVGYSQEVTNDPDTLIQKVKSILENPKARSAGKRA